MKLISVKELINNTEYKLKLVTSIGLFDNYDMFHNIYEQYEEPCRRILVLTKDEKLEEVYEEKELIPFSSLGNIWVKEFPINLDIKEIDLGSVYITSEEYKKIKTMMA